MLSQLPPLPPSLPTVPPLGVEGIRPSRPPPFAFGSGDPLSWAKMLFLVIPIIRGINAKKLSNSRGPPCAFVDSVSVNRLEDLDGKNKVLA